MKNNVNVNKTTQKVKAKFKSFDQRLLYSLLSVLIGILIGVVIMSILGFNPSTLFTSLFKGTFSNITNFGNFLSTFTWIAFLGLAMLVSFRAGIFNIGISSQMVGGGLAGYLFAALVNTPGRIGLIPSILIPILVGTTIALFIAFLKNKFRINEVVSSIMLNWSIYWVYRYFNNSINAPYLFNGSTTTINIYEQNSLRADWLTNMFPDSTINLAIIILIVVVPLMWFLYKKTTFGIKQDIIGNNRGASIYTGLNVDSEIYKAMALSGALAGMAGAAFYLGTNQSLTSVGNDLAPEAFNGITVALIGFNNVFGVVIGSVFVALFENSKIYLSVYANKEIANIIPAIIIWFLALTNFLIIYEPYQKIKNWMNGGEIEFNEFEKQISRLNEKNELLSSKIELENDDNKNEKNKNKILINQNKIQDILNKKEQQLQDYRNLLKSLTQENSELQNQLDLIEIDDKKVIDKLKNTIDKNNNDLLILQNKIELFKGGN